MKTWDKDTGWWPVICAGVASSTEGSDSDATVLFATSEHAVMSLLFMRASSPQSTLRALYVTDVFFFFFFGIFLFVCLSGKGMGIKIARGNTESLYWYPMDETKQGTSALKSSRKKCSSTLVHTPHKPKRGFAFPWVWVLTDRSFWPEGGDGLTLDDPLSCSKWPRQLLINSSIPQSQFLKLCCKVKELTRWPFKYLTEQGYYKSQVWWRWGKNTLGPGRIFQLFVNSRDF